MERVQAVNQAAIDEALILAKELSSDDSSKYIHGVLGRIASIKDTISI